MNSGAESGYPSDLEADSALARKKNRLEERIERLERRIHTGNEVKKDYLTEVPQSAGLILAFAFASAFLLPGISFMIFVLSVLLPTFIVSIKLVNLKIEGISLSSDEGIGGLENRYRRNASEYAGLLIEEKLST